MKTDQLIHNTLEKINWEYVQTTFTSLNLPWYDSKKPSKRDLVNDLISIMQNAILRPGEEVTTEYWLVTYFKYDNQHELQVLFTPIIVSSNQSEKDYSVRIEELKKRIELHVELEQYERCQKYKKQLDKLENKKNKIQ